MDSFFKQWRPKLQQVSSILRYLHTYPQTLSALKMEDCITVSELYEQQEDWVHLCSQFEGEEKEFFKPYWVPIQRNGFDYFIDMSDNSFPIIEAFYDYFDEPYFWDKKIYFSSITWLMLAEDENVDIEQCRIDKIFEKYGKYLSS